MRKKEIPPGYFCVAKFLRYVPPRADTDKWIDFFASAKEARFSDEEREEIKIRLVFAARGYLNLRKSGDKRPRPKAVSEAYRHMVHHLHELQTIGEGVLKNPQFRQPLIRAVSDKFCKEEQREKGWKNELEPLWRLLQNLKETKLILELGQDYAKAIAARDKGGKLKEQAMNYLIKDLASLWEEVIGRSPTTSLNAYDPQATRQGAFIDLVTDILCTIEPERKRASLPQKIHEILIERRRYKKPNPDY